MSSKYELLDECIDVGGHTLYRIRALRSFSYIKTGDLGGFVESTWANLSHIDYCWVYDDAQVYDGSQIRRNAQVRGTARVFGGAVVLGRAQIYENATVSGWVEVSGDAHVYGDAHVSGKVTIAGKSHICGDAYLSAIVPDMRINTRIDHGAWTHGMILDYKEYLLSPTLEKKRIT